MAEQRDLAAIAQDKPVSRAAGAVIIALWMAAGALAIWLVWKYL
jgi:hypothetical protein